MKAAFSLRRLMMLLVLALLQCLIVQKGLAQQEAGEYELKAAFLYNFAGYVEWPPDTFADVEEALIFGVVGAPALADSLEVLGAERRVSGRPLEVRRIRRGGDAEGVHVLFIAGTQHERAGELLASALGNGALTVTESQGERPESSIINFTMVDSKVRFDVSLSLAREAGLGISSRLLQVALRVL